MSTTICPAAVADGTDCIKGDYRVSKDGHGVVVHSSPFHLYESINCDGKRVEDMLLQVRRGRLL
jgi:hypothetical protein